MSNNNPDRSAGLFLTPEELIEFTGYKQPSRQINWLRDHGIRVFVNGLGRPRVLRSDLEHKPAERADPSQEPDLEAVRNLSTSKPARFSMRGRHRRVV